MSQLWAFCKHGRPVTGSGGDCVDCMEGDNVRRILHQWQNEARNPWDDTDDFSVGEEPHA